MNHGRNQARRANKDPNVARQVIGVATAAGLAALAVLASAGHKGKRDFNPDAALQHALRPTLVKTAGEIAGFAHDHPGLTDKQVGKHVIRLVVDGTIKPGSPAGNVKPDHAAMEVVARRQGESTELDPKAALAVSVERSGYQRGSDQTYEADGVIVTPGGAATLTAGSANLHTEGWGAKVTDVADTTKAHDPVNAALAVDEAMPTAVSLVENDLTYAEHSGDQPLQLMP